MALVCLYAHHLSSPFPKKCVQPHGSGVPTRALFEFLLSKELCATTWLWCTYKCIIWVSPFERIVCNHMVLVYVCASREFSFLKKSQVCPRQTALACLSVYLEFFLITFSRVPFAYGSGRNHAFHFWSTTFFQGQKQHKLARKDLDQGKASFCLHCVALHV